MNKSSELSLTVQLPMVYNGNIIEFPSVIPIGRPCGQGIYLKVVFIMRLETDVISHP